MSLSQNRFSSFFFSARDRAGRHQNPDNALSEAHLCRQPRDGGQPRWPVDAVPGRRCSSSTVVVRACAGPARVRPTVARQLCVGRRVPETCSKSGRDQPHTAFVQQTADPRHKRHTFWERDTETRAPETEKSEINKNRGNATTEKKGHSPGRKRLRGFFVSSLRWQRRVTTSESGIS